MFSLRKESPPATGNQVSSSEELNSSGEDNPLAGVTVEGGSYVFEAVNDNQGEGAVDEEQRERVRQAVGRLYSDARFHSNICGLLGWVGRKQSLGALQVDRSDADFKAACDVVYRRLMDGPVGPLFDRLSDQAIEDVVVCLAGFGPVVWGTMAEIKTRKKRPQASDDNQTASQGGDHHATA